MCFKLCRVSNGGGNNIHFSSHVMTGWAAGETEVGGMLAISRPCRPSLVFFNAFFSLFFVCLLFGERELVTAPARPERPHSMADIQSCVALRYSFWPRLWLWIRLGFGLGLYWNASVRVPFRSFDCFCQRFLSIFEQRATPLPNWAACQTKNKIK